MNNVCQEVWKYSHHNVLDIVGVGWKVEDDDEAYTNALAPMQPVKDASYPHTRVLVKWKDGNTTLEHQGFIQQIVNGSSINGDQIIYFKARELKNAYWGYDVEKYWDWDSDNSDYSSSDESQRHHHCHPGKSFSFSKSPQRGNRFIESKQEESDADSETSQSSLDRATRRSKRTTRKTRASKRDKATDDEVHHLTEQVNQLKVKQQQSSHGGGTISKGQHWRKYMEGALPPLP